MNQPMNLLVLKKELVHGEISLPYQYLSFAKNSYLIYY
jgi:hypothetical protein